MPPTVVTDTATVVAVVVVVTTVVTVVGEVAAKRILPAGATTGGLVPGDGAAWTTDMGEPGGRVPPAEGTATLGGVASRSRRAATCSLASLVARTAVFHLFKTSTGGTRV